MKLFIVFEKKIKIIRASTPCTQGERGNALKILSRVHS